MITSSLPRLAVVSFQQNIVTSFYELQTHTTITGAYRIDLLPGGEAEVGSAGNQKSLYEYGHSSWLIRYRDEGQNKTFQLNLSGFLFPS